MITHASRQDLLVQDLLVQTLKLNPSLQYFIFLKNGKYLASKNK